MKVICTLDNFKKAVYNTERVIGKQISLPILENILLETESGVLRLAATNLEIGVLIRVGSKVERGGKVTIPARLVGNFVNNLPGGENLSIETEGMTVKLKSGKYRATIKGMGAEDFPIIPEARGEEIFSLKAREMKDLIPKLLVSVSLDAARPELSGINLLFKHQEVHLAATDSFRLTEGILGLKIEKKEEYAAFTSKNPSIIIPANTFSEILRTIDDTEEIKVIIEENQIFFQIGNVRIVSRLINGKYPEYKQIIPQNFSTQTFINKDDLLRAVRISSFFTENKAGEVSFDLDPEKMRIEVSAESQERGENSTEFQLAGRGPQQLIIFNPRYILDGINAIGSQEIALLANSESTPVALRPVVQEGKEMKVDSRLTYIIMPIKK